MPVQRESKEVDKGRSELIPSISVDSVVKASPALRGVEGGPLLARKEPLNDPPGPLCTGKPPAIATRDADDTFVPLTCS